tara:strand:+ start:4602 stop:5135 length:534 start_codon:yes stop_codon:yes gene_type:complete
MADVLGLFNGSWPTFLFFLGMTLLLSDVLFFSMRTFVLTIAGVSLLLLSGLVVTGIVDLSNEDTAVNKLSMSFAFILVIVTISMWELLRKIHKSGEGSTQEDNEFIEVADVNGIKRVAPKVFRLKCDLDGGNSTTPVYLPSCWWRVRSKAPLSKGELVCIVGNQPGVLIVEKQKKEM